MMKKFHETNRSAFHGTKGPDHPLEAEGSLTRLECRACCRPRPGTAQLRQMHASPDGKLALGSLTRHDNKQRNSTPDQGV